MKTFVLAALTVAALSTGASAQVLCPAGVSAGVCATHNAYAATLVSWNKAHRDQSSLQIVQRKGSASSVDYNTDSI